MLLNLQIDTCYPIITLPLRPSAAAAAAAAAAVPILLVQCSHPMLQALLTVQAL